MLILLPHESPLPEMLTNTQCTPRNNATAAHRTQIPAPEVLQSDARKQAEVQPDMGEGGVPGSFP